MKRKKNYKANSPNRPNYGNKNKQRKGKIENLSRDLESSAFDEIESKKYDVASFYEFVDVKTPRLLAVAKDLKIGKDTAVEFLHEKNYEINSNPSSKLTFDMYVELVKRFKPERLRGFELENEQINTFQNEDNVVLSYFEGKFILRQQRSDGSVVIADGVETKEGIFFPFFSSTSVALSELEELINDSNVSEDDLQKFLERYPELILDNDYRSAIPQARIITDDNSWEADFLLIPYNQNDFSKILELKLPKEQVSNGEKNGHQRLSAKLYHALQQIKDYYDAFDNISTRSRFKEKYGNDIYKPDLQLIIGRKGEFQVKHNFLGTQRQYNIKIMDWDTFLEKQKRKFN